MISTHSCSIANAIYRHRRHRHQHRHLKIPISLPTIQKEQPHTIVERQWQTFKLFALFYSIRCVFPVVILTGWPGVKLYRYTQTEADVMSGHVTYMLFF